MDPQQQQAAPSGQAAPAATNNSQEDYGDKAFDKIAGKEGLHLSRDQSEKVTDGARGKIEKLTGKTIPSKFSN